MYYCCVLTNVHTCMTQTSVKILTEHYHHPRESSLRLVKEGFDPLRTQLSGDLTGLSHMNIEL